MLLWCSVRWRLCHYKTTVLTLQKGCRATRYWKSSISNVESKNHKIHLDERFLNLLDRSSYFTEKFYFCAFYFEVFSDFSTLELFSLFFSSRHYFFCHCWRVGRNFPSCTFLIRLHNSKPTRNQGCSKGCVKHFNLMGFVRDRDWNGRKNLLKNYNIQCCSSNSQRHIIVK